MSCNLQPDGICHCVGEGVIGCYQAQQNNGGIVTQQATTETQQKCPPVDPKVQMKQESDQARIFDQQHQIQMQMSTYAHYESLAHTWADPVQYCGISLTLAIAAVWFARMFLRHTSSDADKDRAARLEQEKIRASAPPATYVHNHYHQPAEEDEETS